MQNWRTDSITGLSWLEPEWDAPTGVRAASTSRLGGVSLAPYDNLNLGTHVGDDVGQVQVNRSRVRQVLELPGEPLWLEQVHGCDVAKIGDRPRFSGEKRGLSPIFDAAWTDQAGQVCVVMTADCLPVLLCNREGSEVAAVHAGWRGLCDGVIESAMAHFSESAGELLAWLGPAIGPAVFEVGDEVREAFLTRNPMAEDAFQPQPEGKWLADIFLLARQRLEGLGITDISGGGICTYSQPERFFSYRRDGVTGRMATLIWIEHEETGDE